MKRRFTELHWAAKLALVVIVVLVAWALVQFVAQRAVAIFEEAAIIAQLVTIQASHLKLLLSPSRNRWEQHVELDRGNIAVASRTERQSWPRPTGGQRRDQHD